MVAKEITRPKTVIMFAFEDGFHVLFQIIINCFTFVSAE